MQRALTDDAAATGHTGAIEIYRELLGKVLPGRSPLESDLRQDSDPSPI